MIEISSIVLYKNSCAIVESFENGKFAVKYRSVPSTATKPAQYAIQNVREKDVVFLCSGDKSSSLEKIFASEEKILMDENLKSSIKDAWELLQSDEETKNSLVEFSELAGLCCSEVGWENSFGFFNLLKSTLFFKLDEKSFNEGKILFALRSQEEIDALKIKAYEKENEAAVRLEFIKRLKQKKLLPEDSKFMVEVESFALGKSEKSKTLAEAHFKETIENAHKILIETGIWDITRNPHPVRWGLSTKSASLTLSSPPEEDRLFVDHTAFAIDAENSADPDDAVYFDGKYLWVHIADPASTVLPDSNIDKMARGRGATLYIPEGAARMLSEDALEDYALGLKNPSNALSFRLLLDENSSVIECEVLKTKVNVKMISYEQAEKQKDSPELKMLFEIARKNILKRKALGAVQINMPEVKIFVDKETKKVSIVQEESFESHDMIREMMLLAGEGAAKFAFQNNIPFVYVSQESPDIPQDLPDGLAHEFRLRRCMKKRSVGVTPSKHSALGLSMYSQVTSPLRRYGDLICHEQLRAFLDKRPLMNKDDMLLKVSEGDAGSQAAHQAERKSNLHWTLVYLMQNPEWTGKAICVDKTPRGVHFSIPSLAYEADLNLGRSFELNEEIIVRPVNINIPELTVNFEIVK